MGEIAAIGRFEGEEDSRSRSLEDRSHAGGCSCREQDLGRTSAQLPFQRSVHVMTEGRAEVNRRPLKPDGAAHADSGNACSEPSRNFTQFEGRTATVELGDVLLRRGRGGAVADRAKQHIADGEPGQGSHDLKLEWPLEHSVEHDLQRHIFEQRNEKADADTDSNRGRQQLRADGLWHEHPKALDPARWAHLAQTRHVDPISYVGNETGVSATRLSSSTTSRW